MTHNREVLFLRISRTESVSATGLSSLPTAMVLATFPLVRPLIRLPTSDRNGETIIASLRIVCVLTSVGSRKASDPFFFAGKTVSKDPFLIVVWVVCLRSGLFLQAWNRLQLKKVPRPCNILSRSP